MPVAAGTLTCLNCYLKHKSCCGTLPECTRCLRSKNQTIPCTWAEGDVAPNSGALTAPRSTFLGGLASSVRLTRKPACIACRFDKKACDGVETGCERCRARGIVCVFRGKRTKTAPSSTPRKRVESRGKRSKLNSDASESFLSRFPSGFLSKGSGSWEEARTPSSSSRGISDSAIDAPSDRKPVVLPIFPRTVFLTANGLPLGGIQASNGRLVEVSQVDGRNGAGSGDFSSCSSSESIEEDTYYPLLGSSEIFGDSLGTPVLFQHVPPTSSFLDWESLSASFPLYSNNPHLFTIPDVVIPLAPSQSWIPDQQRIHIFVDAYFTFADITLNMLNRRTFHNSTPPSLLLASILLLVPHLGTSGVGNDWPPSALSVWTRTLFQLAKAELLAFLDSGEPPTSETIAALVNLYMFCIGKGQIDTGRRLIVLATQLLLSMGLVVDSETLEPPAGLMTWRETLEAFHGADVASRTLSVGELDRIRDLWVEHWTRERIVQLLLYIKWAQTNWDQIHRANKFERVLLGLRRPFAPMASIWQSSVDGTLDPLTLSDPPLIIDVVSPLLSGPSRDLKSLHRITPYLLEQRKAISYWFIVLRARVDHFLVACRDAGIANPALLPLNATEASPPIQQLLGLRTDLDSTILACRNAFPDPIQSGLRSGSAIDMLATLMEPSGCFYYAFNHVLVFHRICLLRLELYSSCGVYLLAGIGLNDPDAVVEDTLADEFARGGALFAELLEDALMFTRILDSWRQLNPRLLYHVEPTQSVVFKVCCIHASFLKKLKKFRAAAADERTSETLLSIERDLMSCLNLLEHLAPVSPWARAVYLVARKTAMDERITEIEKREVGNRLNDVPRVGPVAVEGQTPEEEEQIDVEGEQLKTLLSVYVQLTSSK